MSLKSILYAKWAIKITLKHSILPFKFLFSCAPICKKLAWKYLEDQPIPYIIILHQLNSSCIAISYLSLSGHGIASSKELGSLDWQYRKHSHAKNHNHLTCRSPYPLKSHFNSWFYGLIDTGSINSLARWGSEIFLSTHIFSIFLKSIGRETIQRSSSNTVSVSLELPQLSPFSNDFVLILSKILIMQEGQSIIFRFFRIPRKITTFWSRISFLYLRIISLTFAGQL